MKVPFFRLSFTSAEKKEVLEVLKSGWVTSGPKVREFENRVKRFTRAKHAAAVSSGTAGLHLVLETLGLKAGDEIITTPYSMAAAVEAILYTGARPIFADIEPESLNIDPQCVESKITGKTKAVVSVDIAGYPCDYDKLKKLSEAHNLFLLDDAAHSFGAKYRKKPIGSIADATVFSFYSTKNITTGEGGMVVSDSRRLIDKVRRLSLHGMTSSGWKRHSGGHWRYDITDLGYKYNLSDLAAALGVGQLNRFNTLQKKRDQLARRYMGGLGDLDDLIELPSCGKNMHHAWHLFIIKMTSKRWKIGRDRLISELERRGVGCGVHFIPIYRFSYFKRILRYRPSDFPKCESAFKRVISLPFYLDLTFKEVDYICDVLKKLSAGHAR